MKGKKVRPIVTSRITQKSSITFYFFAFLITTGCAIGYVRQDMTDKWGDLKLWYRQPAQKWTEALPIGNGRLGAMVYGQIPNETIQFNEDTLWTGIPRYYHNPQPILWNPKNTGLLL